MSYLDALKEEASRTETMNGAAAYSTTGNACLDLFSVIGGMRYRSPKSQVFLFDKAYIENPELAMKLLFYLRDIRGGMEERSSFRTLLRHVAKAYPASARKNVAYVSEYGRFDDLLCLLGTPAEEEMVRVIKEQLEADLAAARERKEGGTANISLLAKWLPSVNTSSRATREKGLRLCSLLGLSPYEYRKTLSYLRGLIGLTERYLTEKKQGALNYPAIPAGAMLKYRCAFKKKDKDRFQDYMRKVKKGEETIHSATLFPYEILRPYFGRNTFLPDLGRNSSIGSPVLEALWSHLPKVKGNRGALSVIDVSGSMYWRMHEKAVTPALISQSLGLYHAENCEGLFRGHFITFSEWPELVEIKGETLAQKLTFIQSANWGFNTNLEAVFDLILQTAIKAGAAQEEMPSVLYIISDMEFDEAIADPKKTIYEQAQEKFENAGYALPAVVFLNVNSYQMHSPVRAHTRGSALVSGMGTRVFQDKFDGNITPESHMLRVLLGKRYEKIHA